MGERTRSRENIVVSLITILTIVILDRISKLFFIKLLSVGESIPVVQDVFHFTLVHNTGIAFGLFRNQGILFIIIPIIVLVLIIFHMFLYNGKENVGKANMVAFSLILAGAIGNLADRIIYGHVIDFIDLRVWPVFNIADSAITIGTTILLIKCIPSFAK